MDRERIRAIQRLGDRIAQYIEAENDRRLFQGLLGTHGYRYLRLRLIKASLDSVKTRGEPLITLDEFITVFEQGEEIPRVDWSLARDLVLIRAIEGLKGWLRKEPEVLEEAIEDVESAGEEAGTVDRAPATQTALS
jgi:CRISPR-associated protein Cst1